MKNKAPLLFLVLALVLAAAAAWGAHRWIKNQARIKAASELQMIPLVIAAKDTEPGRALKNDDLALQQWPVAAMPPDVFRQTKDVVGRILMTPLKKGELVLGVKLARPGQTGGLSAMVPEGERAVTVQVDAVIGVGGFLQPGDRVDVMVALRKGQYKDDPAALTLLENIKVFAVGAKVEEASGKKKPTASKTKVVTLLVTPEQGEKLALATNEGKILLAMRSQADQRNAPTPGVRLTSLMTEADRIALEEAAAAEAGELAEGKEPPPPTVEVIKGTARTMETIGVEEVAEEGDNKEPVKDSAKKTDKVS